MPIRKKEDEKVEEATEKKIERRWREKEVEDEQTKEEEEDEDDDEQTKSKGKSVLNNWRKEKEAENEKNDEWLSS